MAERSIVCPSGLAGRVRSLKGRELNLLGDKKAIRSGDLFDSLLRACWLETEDPGPYDFEIGGFVNWSKVLVADRFYALLQIRDTTYPEDPYNFRVMCNDASCGESFTWEVNLSDLPVKPIPEASVEKIRSGEPFTATVEGKKIQFRLTTGADERKGAKFLKGMQQRILEVLNMRVTAIEGVDSKDKLAWLSDLDLSFHRDMINEFDKQDGGVETEIEIECPECGNVFPIDLPFGREFFLPKRRSKDSSTTAQK
jgi:hypothetical protein